MDNEKIKLIGKVVEVVGYQKKEYSYKVEWDDKVVIIISRGLQAVKDYLFIRENQVVKLEGKQIEDTIYVMKASILNGKGEKNSENIE